MTSDRGIGLTELAVAIVVLGIILVGLFPLIINSIGLAQSNSDVGHANRVLATQLDATRSELGASVCRAGTVDLALPESDRGFSAQRSVSCAGTLATVTIEVSSDSSSRSSSEAAARPLAAATTKVVTQ